MKGWKKLWSEQFLSPVENMSLEFSPDARHLVVASADSPTVILDLDSPASAPLRLPLTPGDWPMAYSPDGKRLAVGVTDGVSLLDVQSGEELLKLPLRKARALAFTPDGKHLTVLDAKRATTLHAPPAKDMDFDWLNP